ncbi:MAG: SPOR domain-containing protein [Sedimenticolaceae bacterium]
MAQKNKNPKKDLEKRVAKLKKKVGTLTTSLSKKQSDLSRVLSSVQKQLDKIRKQNASGKVGATQGDRQQELLQTTESLLARLHDLEQTVSIVERAGDELRARTDALEVRAAEAAREGQQRFQVAGEPDGSLQHGLELLRDRTQAVEDHLVHLSGAQESLELQIALLSREAEGDSELTPAGVSLVGPDPAWIERANELSAQIEAVRKSVADETQDAAQLSAHSQQLEAFATQLGQVEQALQERVDRLEQQDTGPGDAPELARQIPELRNMCSRTEEAAGRLSRRTAVLEAGYKGLVEKETRIASQLEALEKRLSELKTAPEVGQSVPAKIPQALEQQVALLSTDRSLHKARIDQVMQRTDELEKTGLDFTRHTDALADRIAALDDGLQALNAEGRLDELDRRGNTLERLLDEEKERIGALTQSEEALDRRLAAAIGDVEALLGRVDALDSGKEQLNKEIDRLDGALRDAAEKAKRQQDLLQTHAAQLEKQREDLADAVAGQKKASEALNGRLATLDESSQALLESADGLKVQQVRQDQDTRTLQQKLKRRSLLGLLMFLLAGGVLVYLLMRGPVVPEGLQSLMNAGSLADQEAKAAIADLEKDTGSMRLELSEMSDSFSEVVRLLDEVSITASAALHSEQLNELTQAMEALGREDQQQRQRHEALQKIQGQQQQGRVELQKAQEQLQQQDAELLQGQQRLQAELDRITEELKALKASAGGKPGAKPPVRKSATEMKPAMVPAPAWTMAAPAWAEAGASGRYTLQLAGFYQPASLAWFVERHHLGQGSAVYHTEFQGRKWYVVFHGIYDTIEQAVEAASHLPPELAAQNPWVRRIPRSGDLFQP